MNGSQRLLHKQSEAEDDGAVTGAGLQSLDQGRPVGAVERLAGQLFAWLRAQAFDPAEVRSMLVRGGGITGRGVAVQDATVHDTKASVVVYASASGRGKKPGTFTQ